MPEEPKTLSLTMPAGLADRLQRALETQHITLEQIVLQWLLFGRRGVRPRPNIPAHFFYEAKTKTLDFALTVPAEVADRIPPALEADQITLERIALGWLLRRGLPIIDGPETFSSQA